MSISIHITNQKVGESYLYSEEDLKGKKKKVPTYQMIIRNESDSVVEFLVTRDVFENKSKEKYGTNMEAPPNKPNKPYSGYIREGGKNGFCIELYEKGVGEQGNYSLKGMGKTIRTNIQIHMGPGCANGCFLLTDGVEERNRFKKTIKNLINEDKQNKIKNPESFVIRVQSKN